MIHLKRHSTINESIETTTKKLRRTFDNKKLNSCFEDLSNELYYEIFDYFEGCQLYEAFSNLNIRFQNLLNSSFIQLKICVCHHSEEKLQHRTTNIIIPNKHQIISLTLLSTDRHYNSNYLPFNINSSFNRLESLILTQIKLNELIPILINLICLPRLFSLTIHNDIKIKLKEISNIYQIIFNLPMLKYNKLSFYSSKIYIPLTVANNQQFTKIEYLNISHSCAINDLINILSYTPRLSHLNCKQINVSKRNILEKSLIKIPTLTHVSIDKCYAFFDDLELFITKISSELQVLRITCSIHVPYLNADRWKQIISQYLFSLHTFEFRYEDYITDELKNTPYYTLANQFYSSFWIKRNYLFRINIDTDDWDKNMIIYSISSCKYNEKNYFFKSFLPIFFIRKTPINFHKDEDIIDTIHQNIIEQSVKSDEQKTINYPIILSESNQLTISQYASIDNEKLFLDIIGPILFMIEITCLNITCWATFIGILIDLIKYLPNLDSLVVSSLEMLDERCLSVEEVRTLRQESNNNKITKMKLRKMYELAEIQFLFELCPQVQCLEVDCINGITPEKFVRFILMKNIKYVSHLSSLCFEIPKTSKDTINKLKKMIDLEQLRQNYTIKQIDNKIYLRWNL